MLGHCRIFHNICGICHRRLEFRVNFATKSASSFTKSGKENVEDEAETAKLLGDGPWVKWWDGSVGNNPGKCNLPVVSIPDRLDATAKLFLANQDKKMIGAVSKKLCDLLISRRTCKEMDGVVKQPSRRAQSTRENIPPVESLSDFSKLPESFYSKMVRKEKQKKSVKLHEVYEWKQIVYDDLNTAAYLVGRSPACYASTLRVLSEIKKNLPDFKPNSLLDFGSGTGMCVWAANSLWEDSLKQYICVDSSMSMNKLAFYLFSGGDYEMHLPGLFIRQFLPISYKNTYDIVISAYSLSELPSEKERLMLLKLLWNKTDRFLVLIDNGNFYGYYTMMEARNLLLHGLEGTNTNTAKKWSKFCDPATVFSPCPHDNECPMWGTTKSCVFKQKYFAPKYSGGNKNNSSLEKFSYVILEKGGRSFDLEKTWPRVIADPQTGKCATCHICTPGGTIEHIKISKAKYGTDLTQTVKKSSLGDCIPLTARPIDEK